MDKISDRMVKALKSRGVTTVFGIPSIHNIGLYDALRRDGGIRHILCRHEGSAVHMADGYARSGAGVGVVIASTGPGVAYTLSPLIEAWCSCSPVMIVTSNVRLDQMEQELGVLHEFGRQHAAFESVTKKRFCLGPDDDIAQAVGQTVDAARSGRPGPVYLEVPTDMWDFETDIRPDPDRKSRGGMPAAADLDSAAKRIMQSRAPLMIAGIEAVHAGLASDITALAEAIHGVVLTDAGGKGVISEEHPLSFGNVTNGGVVKEIHRTCDVTLSLGSRLRYVDFRRKGIRLPGLIHVDWDERWTGKNFKTDIRLIGDVRSIVGELTARLAGSEVPPARRDFVARMNQKRSRVLDEVPGLYRETAYIGALRQAIPDAGILVADNTMLGYFAEQVYPSRRPLGFVPAKGASPIGFAFPAAVGMKIGRPSDPVVALIGDGGFLYGSQELSTCAAAGVGFPVVVVNDGAFRMIDYLQNARYQAGHETTLVNPDFSALAASYGVRASRADSPESLCDALKQALDSGKMWLIALDDTFPDPPFGKF